MNKAEIEELFTQALKDKLVGILHTNDRLIEDVRVSISNYCVDIQEWGGLDLDELKIEVKTSSPKGKTFKWKRYYI